MSLEIYAPPRGDATGFFAELVGVRPSFDSGRAYEPLLYNEDRGKLPYYDRQAFLFPIRGLYEAPWWCVLRLLLM